MRVYLSETIPRDKPAGLLASRSRRRSQGSFMELHEGENIPAIRQAGDKARHRSSTTELNFRNAPHILSRATNPAMARPQFLIDLERDGYVVVPDVIPKSSCDDFIEQAWQWLEGFPNGFKRDDRSTWTAEHLPYGHSKGLYNRYCVNHEAFVWKIRTEPGIFRVFSQVWGTDDLIASFDGMNVSLPVNDRTGRKDIGATEPWPHIDQNPRTISELELYQGIANLAPNGPDDGGLVVLAGSHKLHQRHFDKIGGFKTENDWYIAQGCKETKICANAGDLILWDSRTIHWNCNPAGMQTRFCTYVCFCPRSKMSEEMLAKKREVFEARRGTTHWPQMNIVPVELPNYYNAKPRRPDGSLDLANRDRPMKEPVVTPEVLRLVGVRA